VDAIYFATLNILMVWVIFWGTSKSDKPKNKNVDLFGMK